VSRNEIAVERRKGNRVENDKNEPIIGRKYHDDEAIDV
jgi:hypothetical protein